MTGPAALGPVEPGGVVASSLRAAIRSWVESPPLRDLVEAFATPWPEGILGDVLGTLGALSTRQWDFRRGSERNLAGKEPLTEQLAGSVGQAANHLGLVDAVPPSRERYDHVLILGGLVRACVLRPWFTARLLDAGLDCGEITALGGFRELRGDELALAQRAGIGAVSNEVEAMDAGVRRSLGATAVVEERRTGDPNAAFSSSLVRRYAAEGVRNVSVVAAPSTDPTRRANTADTYRYWAEHVASLSRDDRVLLVTSTIYVPFQHADAIRMLALPYGVGVETVGVDTSAPGIDPPLRQAFEPSQYLQEIGSAIRALRALVAALDQMTDS